jgi:hypothetical protein
VINIVIVKRLCRSQPLANPPSYKKLLFVHHRSIRDRRRYAEQKQREQQPIQKLRSSQLTQSLVPQLCGELFGKSSFRQTSWHLANGITVETEQVIIRRAAFAASNEARRFCFRANFYPSESSPKKICYKLASPLILTHPAS